MLQPRQPEFAAWLLPIINFDVVAIVAGIQQVKSAVLIVGSVEQPAGVKIGDAAVASYAGASGLATAVVGLDADAAGTFVRATPPVVVVAAVVVVVVVAVVVVVVAAD